MGSPIATVFRGLRDAGLENTPVATSPGNEVYREMGQFAAISARSSSIPSPRPGPPGAIRGSSSTLAVVKHQEQFFHAFEEIGAKPGFQGSNEGWQPAMLAVGALRSLGAGATAAQYPEAICSISKAFPASRDSMISRSRRSAASA